MLIMFFKKIIYILEAKTLCRTPRTVIIPTGSRDRITVTPAYFPPKLGLVTLFPPGKVQMPLISSLKLIFSSKSILIHTLI